MFSAFKRANGGEKRVRTSDITAYGMDEHVEYCYPNGVSKCTISVERRHPQTELSFEYSSVESCAADFKDFQASM